MRRKALVPSPRANFIRPAVAAKKVKGLFAAFLFFTPTDATGDPTMAGETQDAKVVFEAVDHFSKTFKDFVSNMGFAARAAETTSKALQTLDPGPSLSKISAAGKGIAESQTKVGKAAQAAKGVYSDAQGKMADASGRFVKQAKADQDRHAQATNGWASVVRGIYERLGHIMVDVMLKAGREVVQFATDSIKLAADFETGMKKIESAAGGSLAEAGLTMDDVKKKALELGQKTAFSAGQAQEAFLNLVKGGVPIKTAFGEATQATLDLAAAADVELGPAAEYIAKMFAAWSAEGVTATRIADVMSQTAQASSVNADDLALGLYNVGTAAQNMGMNFEDVNRGIALVVSGFSGGAEAGTGFKSMIAGLTPSSKGATKAMKELGLITKDGASVFFDAKGNYEGLADTAGELQKAFAGLSEEQKAVYAETIFGTYGMNAAMQLMKKGSEGVADMAANMDKLGSAQEQAKKRQEGFAYAMDQFNGTIETLKIVIGTPLIGLITMLMETAIIPLANSILGLAGNFSIAGGTMDKIKSVVLNIGSTFKNLFGVISDPGNISNTHALGFALQTFMPKDMATKVSMFVRSVVIGLGKAIAWVQTNWPKISEKIGEVLNFLVGMAERFGIPFVTTLTGILANAIAWVVTNWPEISNKIDAVLATISFLAVTYVLPFINDVIAFLGQAVTWVQTEWPKVQEWINAGLTAVEGFVATYIAPFVTTLLAEIGKVVTWVQTEWPKVEEWINAGLTAVEGFVATYIAPFVTTLLAEIGKVVNWVVTNWPEISAKIGSGLSTVSGFVATYIAPFVTTLIGAIGKAVTWVIENWPKISGTIGTVLSAIGQILSIFTPLVDALKYAFDKVVSFVIENFPLMAKTAEVWQSRCAAVLTAISPLLTILGGAFKLAFAIIGEVLKTFVDVGLLAFKVAMQVFTGDIGGALDTIKTFFTDKFNAVKRFLGELVPQFLTLGGNILTGLLDGLKSKGSQILDYLIGLADSAIQGFKDKFKIASPSKVMEGIAGNIVQGIQKGITLVEDVLDSHSPSRVFEYYGEMTMQGYVNGLWSMREAVADAMRGVLESAVVDVGSMMGDLAGMAMDNSGVGSALGDMAAAGVEGGTGATDSAFGRDSTQTVNVNVDGQTVARAVVRHGAAPVAAQRRRQYSGGGSNKFR